MELILTHFQSNQYPLIDTVYTLNLKEYLVKRYFHFYSLRIIKFYLYNSFLNLSLISWFLYKGTLARKPRGGIWRERLGGRPGWHSGTVAQSHSTHKPPAQVEAQVEAISYSITLKWRQSITYTLWDTIYIINLKHMRWYRSVRLIEIKVSK